MNIEQAQRGGVFVGEDPKQHAATPTKQKAVTSQQKEKKNVLRQQKPNFAGTEAERWLLLRKGLCVM